jgi:transposase
MAFEGISDEQWAAIDPLLPVTKRTGRPKANSRRVLNGIIYVLLTGTAWGKLPAEYGKPTTCWRRLRYWSNDGTWFKIWRTLLPLLNDQEREQWSNALLQGHFHPCRLTDKPVFDMDMKHAKQDGSRYKDGRKK